MRYQVEAEVRVVGQRLGQVVGQKLDVQAETGKRRRNNKSRAIEATVP
jgi:uncharacterized protein Veg